MTLFDSKLYSDAWCICYREKGDKTIFDDAKTPFKIIKNGTKSWTADPFLIEKDGETYIFAELYDYALRRGLIAYTKIKKRGKMKWKKIICEDYHMSYPYIFEYENNIHIMPETRDNTELCVYRAIEFPDKWEKIKVLRSDEKIVDTTLFNVGEKYYALTYDIEDNNRYHLRWIDFSDKDGDKELFQNDSKRVRPAGCFFEKDGKTYRPAQICDNMYGEGLIFYQCWLDLDGYNEKAIKEIYPSDIKLDKKLKGIIGMHTYNFTDKYEVIDIQFRRFNVFDVLSKIVHKIKIIFKKGQA